MSAPVMSKVDYLHSEQGIKSWLLTTDHKRIAWLYIAAITFFFFVGGFAALLMRLELLTPRGDVVTSETYNKLFTMHGIIMVWFFLIPSIPNTLGNFVIPMMIGAMVRPAVRELRFDTTTLMFLPRILAAYRGGDNHLLTGVAGMPARPVVAPVGSHEIGGTV